LGAFTGYGERLLTAGLYPFVLGDLVKSAVAALLFVVGGAIIPGLGSKSGKVSDAK
jgi:biotin transporter BioY